MNNSYEHVQRNAAYINGAFMETSPDKHIGYSFSSILRMENTLRWLEKTLREPRINCLEPRTLPMSDGELNSPEVRRWMRLFTTMS